MKHARLLLEKIIAIICAISFIILSFEYKSFPKETKIYYFLTLLALLFGAIYGLVHKYKEQKSKPT
ncbi:MAG: hypothetical protein RL372_1610 [Bacteroidota bacterium]|jgi:hypothetical protein